MNIHLPRATICLTHLQARRLTLSLLWSDLLGSMDYDSTTMEALPRRIFSFRVNNVCISHHGYLDTETIEHDL